MNLASRRTLFVLSLVMMGQLVLAQKTKCPVGVNVNSFQNFSVVDQQVIVEQLKRSGVGFVRTSLRPDDKNMTLAKNLQSEGIGLVLATGAEFSPNAMPLSYADLERSRAYYQTVFDKLDDKGVVLAGIEVGNEINWTDFNGDFPIPGQGKAFTP